MDARRDQHRARGPRAAGRSRRSAGRSGSCESPPNARLACHARSVRAVPHRCWRPRTSRRCPNRRWRISQAGSAIGRCHRPPSVAYAGNGAGQCSARCPLTNTQSERSASDRTIGCSACSRRRLTSPSKRQQSSCSIRASNTTSGHIAFTCHSPASGRREATSCFALTWVASATARPRPGAEANIAYPAQMLDDAREAIAFVRKEAPRRPVIVAGLCSGGWLAFRAAREGLPVDAIVSINPPLYLREAAGVRWATDRDELRRYKRSMGDSSKWWKALGGDVSYATFIRVAANSLSRHVTGRVTGVFRDAMRDGLARDLYTIADRGIRSALRLQPRRRRARIFSPARAAGARTRLGARLGSARGSGRCGSHAASARNAACSPSSPH